MCYSNWMMNCELCAKRMCSVVVVADVVVIAWFRHFILIAFALRFCWRVHINFFFCSESVLMLFLCTSQFLCSPIWDPSCQSIPYANRTYVHGEFAVVFVTLDIRNVLTLSFVKLRLARGHQYHYTEVHVAFHTQTHIERAQRDQWHFGQVFETSERNETKNRSKSTNRIWPQLNWNEIWSFTTIFIMFLPTTQRNYIQISVDTSPGPRTDSAKTTKQKW